MSIVMRARLMLVTFINTSTSPRAFMKHRNQSGAHFGHLNSFQTVFELPKDASNRPNGNPTSDLIPMCPRLGIQNDAKIHLKGHPRAKIDPMSILSRK